MGSDVLDTRLLMISLCPRRMCKVAAEDIDHRSLHQTDGRLVHLSNYERRVKSVLCVRSALFFGPYKVHVALRCVTLRYDYERTPPFTKIDTFFHRTFQNPVTPVSEHRELPRSHLPFNRTVACEFSEI